MAKKKERKIFNIDEVNIEIDYDKLADAIVKAQDKSKAKHKEQLNLRTRAMRFFNGLCYSIVYVVAVSCIYIVWKQSYPTNSIPLHGCILVSSLFAFVGIYAFLCQQESFGDSNDESLAHFNTNVALIALIVALVALMKGLA